MSGGWGTPTWMQPGPDVGETLVQGKSADTARSLLAAARDLGMDTGVVRTVTGGFVVPNAVWDQAEQDLTDHEQF